MLIDALVDQRRSLPAADYAVVLIIPAVTAAFGFLWGVAVGLLAAALFFIVTFARIDFVRLETTAARMRSRLERPEAEQAGSRGSAARRSIYVLAGYVFFGTAHRLVSRIEAALARTPAPRFVLIDLERVRGIDVSAARALARLDEACRAASASWCSPASTPPPPGSSAASRAGPRATVATARGSAGGGRGRADRRCPSAVAVPGLVDQLQRRHPAADVSGYFEAVSVPADAEVIAQGDPSDFLLVLTSGLLRAEVTRPDDGAVVMVARCLPGALVGEIGLYAGVPRTARVVAEAPSAFLRLDARRSRAWPATTRGCSPTSTG